METRIREMEKEAELEYFVRARLSDLLKKGSIAASRMFAALRFVSRTDCYRLVLGRDVAGAADAAESVLARSESGAD